MPLIIAKFTSTLFISNFKVFNFSLTDAHARKQNAIDLLMFHFIFSFKDKHNTFKSILPSSVAPVDLFSSISIQHRNAINFATTKKIIIHELLPLLQMECTELKKKKKSKKIGVSSFGIVFCSNFGFFYVFISNIIIFNSTHIHKLSSATCLSSAIVLHKLVRSFFQIIAVDIVDILYTIVHGMINKTRILT